MKKTVLIQLDQQELEDLVFKSVCRAILIHFQKPDEIKLITPDKGKKGKNNVKEVGHVS